MNVARIAERQGRAVVLVTLLLAGAGALVLPSLPSGIYPPLQFPRLLVIAHSGSLPARSMMASVTRPPCRTSRTGWPRRTPTCRRRPRSPSIA